MPAIQTPSPTEAIALQKRLAAKVVLKDDLPPINYVAGVDVGFPRGGEVTRAVVAVLNYPDLTLAEYALIHRPTEFPYIPGLLSFRELPAILEAYEKLTIKPDLILSDGQGIAHPRRLGIASHLGLVIDKPTIGVAKTRLVGSHHTPPNERGGWVPLMDGEEEIGAVLRSRVDVKPLYISPGHRISLTSSIQWVMRCTSRYRLPETTRWAHRLASGSPRQIERALERGRL